MKVKCQVNSKSNPIIAHKYELQFKENLEEDPTDRVYVMVKYLKMKDLQKNTMSNLEGQTQTSVVDMFTSQVTEIHNVTNSFTGKDMTVDEIAESPMNPILMSIMTDVMKHLQEDAVLTGEEIKN